MSKENAKSFYEKIIASGKKEMWQSKSADEMNEIIAKEGYDFTLEELNIVIKDDIMNQELSDDEVDMVSGGRRVIYSKYVRSQNH